MTHNRAKLVANEWEKRAKGLTGFEKEWRWMAFLISETSKYSKDVGHDVDVLELSAAGKSRWLQEHGACPSPER
jgi:hypothetical protein